MITVGSNCEILIYINSVNCMLQPTNRGLYVLDIFGRFDNNNNNHIKISENRKALGFCVFEIGAKTRTETWHILCIFNNVFSAFNGQFNSCWSMNRTNSSIRR